MFGYHKAKREKRRAARAANQMQAPQASAEPTPSQEELIAQKVKDAEEKRAQNQQKGFEEGEAFVNKPIAGLDPEQKKAMQYEANQQARRYEQAASRKLLGDQATRGIVGKGGVAYAQQKDIQNQANELRGQSLRDINKLETDMALKKKAAILAFSQGKIAQSQLDEELARADLELEEQKRKNKFWEDQFNRNFSRI